MRRSKTIVGAAAFFLSALSLCPSAPAAEKIKIAATTSTLESIAKEITGEAAVIHRIASPKRDIHFISPTPKDVLKVKKADVFIHLGLDAEPWRQPLLEAAGNASFISGERAIDVSKGITLLEVPRDVSRKEGDIHLYGNTHYWTDPENAKIMAQNIAEGLGLLYPEYAADFSARAFEFTSRLDQKTAEWKSLLAPYEGVSIITYHNSWPYFAKRYGLLIAGNIEPKPGIPPGSRHTAELMRLMKEKNIPVIVEESYYEDKTARKIAQETGAAVVAFVQSVGAVEESPDYIAMMDYNVKALESALKGKPRA